MNEKNIRKNFLFTSLPFSNLKESFLLMYLALFALEGLAMEKVLYKDSDLFYSILSPLF